MRLIPVILDCQVEFPGDRVRRSLLDLPAGTGRVLDRVCKRLALTHEGKVLVVRGWPDAPRDPSPVAFSQGPAIQVLAPGSLCTMLREAETSDYLYLVEAWTCPLWPGGEARVEHFQDDFSGATYGIAVGCRAEALSERIETDDDGGLRCVQRMYGTRDWSQVSDGTIVHAVVPARALAGLSQAHSCRILQAREPLCELRRHLVVRGVTSRDVAQACAALDLRTEGAFLDLSELEIAAALSNGSDRRASSRVLLGPGCRIHKSARLVPPVIIGANTQIAEGAVIVGPALISNGCCVGTQAVIAQSVLLDSTTVPAGVSVRQRVVGGPIRPESGSEAGSGQIGPESPVDEFPREMPLSSTVPGASMPRRADPLRCLQLAVKRTVDAGLAGLALLLLSPVLVLVALLIKLDSRGPVFFRHRREGRDGREFECLKFRTMVPDAHSAQLDLYRSSQVDGPHFKIDHDPRVTPIGRWLRGTNLDELPQLINVLAGDMSFVGPRPSPFRENQICVQWRRARLSVRPGITGLWQICRDADRSRGGFHEWIYYDLAYVRSLSLWLDLKIVLATLLTMGGRRQVPTHYLIRPNLSSTPTGQATKAWA